MDTCSSLSLNCLDLQKFVVFLAGTTIVPYILYRCVSNSYNWKRKREKSPSKHFETIITAMSSMAILWFVGNYEQTYDRITFLATIVGILGFAYIVEKMTDTHKHTLATMHKWNASMHRIVIVAVLVISVFAVHHVSLASEVSTEFRNVYISAAIIPIALVYFATKVTQWENSKEKRSLAKKNGNLLFHLHHVHLFYALAFFTRFPDFWSKVAAGLAIGASMHGASAFGYDKSFEEQ